MSVYVRGGAIVLSEHCPSVIRHTVSGLQNVTVKSAGNQSPPASWICTCPLEMQKLENRWRISCRILFWCSSCPPSHLSCLAHCNNSEQTTDFTIFNVYVIYSEHQLLQLISVCGWDGRLGNIKLVIQAEMFSTGTHFRDMCYFHPAVRVTWPAKILLIFVRRCEN